MTFLVGPCYNVIIKEGETVMDNRTFKVAGTSTDPKGSSKVRFANDYVGRIKILNMRKHTDIKLIELEKPMNKKEICDFLLGLSLIHI